jgi:hypothetical protein
VDEHTFSTGQSGVVVVAKRSDPFTQHSQLAPAPGVGCLHSRTA